MIDIKNGSTGKKAKRKSTRKRRVTEPREYVEIPAKEIANDSDIVVPHQICVYIRQPLPHDAYQPTEATSE